MTNEEAISFYTKMNLVRADLLSLDWKDDKFLSLGGRNGYNYLSIDKIKRNIAPVLQKHRVELGIDYENLSRINDSKDALEHHWTVKLKATLIDVDTGYERRYSAYGESFDRGDKGVNKAQTAAMKQFLSNVFMLIDGIDPDAGVGESTGFTPKTPTEVLVAKSKVLANAVKPAISTMPEKAPATPDVKPKPEPEPEPVSEVSDAPVEVKVEPENPVEPVAEVCAPEEPTVDVKVGDIVSLTAESIKDLKVTGPQRNAIAKIIETRTQMALDGKLTPAEYNQMSADYASIKDHTSGTAFISKYRVVNRV